jgi:hypothetical protein
MINLDGVVARRWQDAPAREIFPGIRKRILWEDPRAVRKHRHDYPAGSFIHNPAGSAHVPQSTEGCVLFVFFPGG